MSVLHEHNMEATKKEPLMSWAPVIYRLIRSEKINIAIVNGATVNRKFKEKNAVIMLPLNLCHNLNLYQMNLIPFITIKINLYACTIIIPFKSFIAQNLYKPSV